jgi:hypothetical protein
MSETKNTTNLFWNLYKRLRNLQFNYMLFLACFSFLFLLPMLGVMDEWIYKLNLFFVLLFSLLSLKSANRKFVILGLFTVLINLLSNIGDNSKIGALLDWFSIVFLGWTIASLLGQFIKIKKVSPLNLLSAFNGYLLLGIISSILVIYLERHTPGSIQSTGRAMQKSDLIYFTLTTLTTTGYGDILPVNSVARHLSTLISISGQFYVAVFVAILVSKFVANSKQDEKPEDVSSHE